MVEHVKLDSSNVKSAGYDKETQTLEVSFHSGATYEYADVPESVYKSLIEADSVGSFFFRHIRKGGYEATRVS